MRLAMYGVFLAVAATPAVAQSRYGPPAPVMRGTGITGVDAGAREPTVGREIGDVREQIRRGRESGTLSKRQGRALRREASQIDALADRYGADGLSDSERGELDTRTRVLRDLTNSQRIRGTARPR